MDRNIVRVTALKVFRSDELIGDERAVAAGMLAANPGVGNPWVVRCPWCHETRTLFSDETNKPFERVARGWRCETCDLQAASQEARM
jgi:hypothetical protein